MPRFIEVLAAGLLAAQVLVSQPVAAGTPETERVIPSLDGQTLYVTYCAVCHGVRGDGAGPMAQALKHKVPDLTEIAARNRGVFPLIRVQKIIEGTEPAGTAHGSREMPIWGPVFSSDISDRDYGKLRIFNVANYVLKMQKKP